MFYPGRSISVSSNLWIAGTVLLIIGVVIAVAGIVLNTYSISSRPYEGMTEGKVVDIVSVERNPNEEAEFRNRQAAVFEFYANGKLMKVVDRHATYPCPYERNQKVRICYDPEFPVRFRVIHAEKRSYLSVILNIVGVIFILGGVFLFMRYAVRFMI